MLRRGLSKTLGCKVSPFTLLSLSVHIFGKPFQDFWRVAPALVCTFGDRGARRIFILPAAPSFAGYDYEHPQGVRTFPHGGTPSHVLIPSATLL